MSCEKYFRKILLKSFKNTGRQVRLLLNFQVSKILMKKSLQTYSKILPKFSAVFQLLVIFKFLEHFNIPEHRSMTSALSLSKSFQCHNSFFLVQI